MPISATKAAVAEGIVPGGGLALLRCIEAVAREEAKCEGDERTGVQILKRALEAPARQIAENSAVDGGVVVARMLDGQGQLRLRRRPQGICRSGRGRHHRSDQGGARRAGERGFGRQRAAADRGDDDRGAGTSEGPSSRSARDGLVVEGNSAMTGIVLSPEQIRAAPSEVRRWIEQEVASMLAPRPEGGYPVPPVPPAPGRLQPDGSAGHPDARAGLPADRQRVPSNSAAKPAMLPLPGQGLRRFRLADVMHAARLQTPEQVVRCLEALNEALRRVRNDEGATLYALDQQGNCLIAEQTQRSILVLWQRIIGGDAPAANAELQQPAVLPHFPPSQHGASDPDFGPPPGAA